MCIACADFLSLNLTYDFMKTNVLLALDTRRAKKDGTYPILARIVHHRIATQITTGIYVNDKDWDNNKRLIKSSHKGTESVVRLNNYLGKMKAEIIDTLTKLDEKKLLQSLSTNELKSILERNSNNNSFFEYANTLIDEMKVANRIGNARYYRIVVGVLRKFVKDKPLSFQEINYEFLMKFTNHNLSIGNSYNGVAAYMRCIRAIFNKAIKAKIIDKELYPFTEYSIVMKKTRKRSIGFDAIQKIIDLKVNNGDSLFHCKNYFLLSFYMRGMPFADLAKLKKGNIVDGRIMYQRRKTDKPYNVKITSEIQDILNMYVDKKGKNDFILPIIKRQTAEEQYKDVEWARKQYNKTLKEIAELCGIEENLTSYVSRHSFATRAKNLGVPIATISDMLGHADTKTTEIYLDSLQSDLMDEAHEKIIR